jgi:hypothetical protein
LGVRFFEEWEGKKNEVVWKTPRIQAFVAYARPGVSDRIGETRDSRRSKPRSRFEYDIFNLSKRSKSPEKTPSQSFLMFNLPTNSGEEAKKALAGNNHSLATKLQKALAQPASTTRKRGNRPALSPLPTDRRNGESLIGIQESTVSVLRPGLSETGILGLCET